VLADARADRYRFALETVMSDPDVDGLLVVLTPQAMTEIEATAEAVGNLSNSIDKPIITSFMGEAQVESGIELLERFGVPNYPFPERAALAYKAMSDYQKVLKQPTSEYVKFDIDRQSTFDVLKSVRAQRRLSIGDSEARKILTAYGFKIPKSEIAATPDDAVDLAHEIGFPVVLKIASPDILHKTDVGGVKTGLNNTEDVRDAFELMVYRAQRYLPQAHLWGCLVQEMVPAGGQEVLVGMNRDPQFGPLVTFGLGGIYVETLKDVTFRVAPISKQEAKLMLSEIRARAILDGVRGNPPLDKEAIVDAILRIAQLVQDFPEILELDINPLMVYPRGQGAIAIDMRLVLSK
jgi:acetyltransferase